MNAHPYNRFMILSSPRCGSHMLRTSLDCHPQIECHTEVFNPDFTVFAPYDRATPAVKILDNHIFGTRPSEIQSVGFILHRSGANFGGWQDLWPRLEKDDALRIVSLRRENLLRRYLSYLTMKEPRERKLHPRTLDPVELEAEFEARHSEITSFDERFAGHPLLVVTYEQLCHDHANTLEAVQHFLSVPVTDLAPDTNRNPRLDLRSAISNYDALRAHFEHTPWAGFFDDRPEPPVDQIKFGGYTGRITIASSGD